jgi:hypothetical protein
MKMAAPELLSGLLWLKNIFIQPEPTPAMPKPIAGRRY